MAYIKGPWQAIEDGTQWEIRDLDLRLFGVIYKEEKALDQEVEDTALLIVQAPEMADLILRIEKLIRRDTLPAPLMFKIKGMATQIRNLGGDHGQKSY